MAKLILKQVSPPSNPDTMLCLVQPSANYVVGTADPVDLTAIQDPDGIGVIPMPSAPAVTPALANEDIAGYYGQVQRLQPSSPKNFGIRWFQPGGAEVVTGAMPAEITGGEIFLEVFVNVQQNQ